MGIESIISKNCTQDCVYWAPGAISGFGVPTYGTPVALKCRWEEKSILFSDDKGVEIQAKAVVHLTSDVVEEGILYLGTITSLTTTQKNNPKDLIGAFPIKRFDKSPSLLDSTVFVRKAYLTPYGGMN